MPGFADLLAGFSAHPAATLASLEALVIGMLSGVIGWLAKKLLEEKDAHKATALGILPATMKVAESLPIMERQIERMLSNGQARQ